MQLKTFSAKSSADVLSQIRAEFGPDAVILESREEDGMFHMTAALERHAPLPDAEEDDYGPAPARGAKGAYSAFSSIPGVASDAGLAGTDGKKPQSGSRTGRKTAAPPRCGTDRPAPETGKGARAANRAYRSAASLREMEESALPAGPAPALQWQEEWSSIKAHLLSLMRPALRLDLLAPRQRLALEYLHSQGVEEEFLLRLFERLRDDPAATILAPLTELVGVRPWSEDEWPQRVHCISGPFGAGKSSVAIRMALSLRRAAPDCRLCLINADATRGNGRLLLRHYCELSDLEYSEASSTLELVAALNKAERAGYERILIDLPGIGRDKRLTTLLADAGMMERRGETRDDVAVHLALPPQYSGPEMRAIIDRYRSGHAGSIVWTRLDEAVQYGQIVNGGMASGLPVSALSYGPGLGHSFVPAQAAMVWRLVFKKELPSG